MYKMTILAFWKVGDSDMQRHTLDNVSHEEAFDILWHRQDELGARFYDVEDYNDELLDGGYWCKSLLVRSSDVRRIVKE